MRDTASVGVLDRGSYVKNPGLLLNSLIMFTWDRILTLPLSLGDIVWRVEKVENSRVSLGEKGKISPEKQRLSCPPLLEVRRQTLSNNNWKEQWLKTPVATKKQKSSPRPQAYSTVLIVETTEESGEDSYHAHVTRRESPHM